MQQLVILLQLYPRLVIYLISAIRVIVEEINKAKCDKINNQRLYQKLNNDGTQQQILSKDIKQGDILTLKADDIVPADCLLISSQKDKNIFVSTSALDGEQNFKPKSCIYIGDQLNKFDVRLDYPEPSLAQFNGMIKINNDEQFTHFSIQNIVLSCTKIESSETEVKALVLYCGKQAKINQTQDNKKLKQSKLHKRIILLTCFEAFLAVFLMFILPLGNISTMDYNHLHYISFDNEQTEKGANYLEKVVCYFILNGYFLPVSLFVVIEIMRLLNTIQFNSDKRIEGSYIKNTMAVENLGEVDYLVSDKTGTLTKNQLTMYEISSQDRVEINNRKIFDTNKDLQDYDLYSINQIVLWNLAICNDVHIHPITNAYQGESLDEIIFVQSCLALGVKLINKSNEEIVFQFLQNKQLNQVRIKILAQIKFNSYNKYSMGIYQEISENGQYFLPQSLIDNGNPFVLFKGSEQLLDYADQNQNKQFVIKQLDKYSQKGLRTLLFMHKQIDKDCLQQFLDVYPQIKTLSEQDSQFLDAIQKIKCNLQISGVTAVQDELQDELKETIKYLSKAGIRQSMITGDRADTALNIGRNCGLVKQNNIIINLTQKNLSKDFLKEQIQSIMDKLSETDKKCASKQLQKILLMYQSQKFDQNKQMMFQLKKKADQAQRHHVQLQQIPNYTILIDNLALKQIQQDNLQHLLAMLIYLSHSCIFARMSPAQKQYIVKILKFYFPNQTVLAIGDGSNDRSMIKESDIGVAILGNEGLSAANDADVVIKYFKQLRQVIGFYGRHDHNRYKELFEYQIEKNSILAFTNMLYGTFVLGTQTIVMDSWLLMMFNVVIAVIPILVQSVSEQDIPEKALINHPELYRSQRYMRRPTLHSIIKRMLRAVWYSICLIFIPFVSHGMGGQFSDGTVSDFNCESLVVYIALLFSTSLELFVHQNYYTYMLLASFIIMVIVVAASLWGFNYNTTFGSTLISVIPTVQNQLSFHLRWLFTGLMCSTPSIFYQTIRRLYYPDQAEIARHIYGPEDNTCCQKQIIQSQISTHTSTLQAIVPTSTATTNTQSTSILIATPQQNIQNKISQIL